MFKKYALVLFVVVASVTQAQAATLRTAITCSRTEGTTSLQVGIVPGVRGNEHTILVAANFRVVYQMKLANVQAPRPEQTYYYSAQFENANRAPSTLMLQVYREAGLLKGEFSEVTYLPVLPREFQAVNWGMKCTQGGMISFR